MRNGVQLIAYADRLGGNIRALQDTIDSAFRGGFTGIHLLPFYLPFDGADAGFDPIDHTQVDPRLGSWSDLQGLSSSMDVMTDLIVNHVSRSSASFADVVRHGRSSQYHDMFLTLESIFPNGATEQDLTRIYRPRPGLPFTQIVLGGEKRMVWTTFTAEQVDINIRSEAGRSYLREMLDVAAENGVTSVRLDAVGYAVKTAGTSCFMTSETYAFVDEFAAMARDRGVDVLVEVHSHFEDQLTVASQVDRVYDFALPPLVLHTLYTGDVTALAHWLSVRPSNAVTVLDTHDGIGIVDVGPAFSSSGKERPGLLTAEQIDHLVAQIHQHTNGDSELATGAAASNLDLYQVNSTFYDALGRDDRSYLLARAIQLFVPGVPQVYYVGMLAGENDVELLQRTGVGRDINRHRFSPEEVLERCERPVVKSLLNLCRWRNAIPAFDGEFTFQADGSTLSLSWRRQLSDGEWSQAQLDADVRTADLRLSWSDGTTEHAVTDLSELEGLLAGSVTSQV